jgi:RNA polymerase-binding transcription factor DksA
LLYSISMDIAAAEEALTQEERRLREQLKSIGRENPAVPGEWEPLPRDATFEPDPLDRAELVTSQEDTMAILAELGARHKNVTEALARIHDGTYGTCKVCAKPIEPERLAADPAATTCTEHR